MFFNIPENQAESNGVILRLPFDLPVVPYTNEGISSALYHL